MFDEILGQPYAVAVLQNALTDERLAGSYLFVGPDGVGKRTTALAFAKSLCGAETSDSPAARAIDAGRNPDVRIVDPPPSGIISIAQLWPRAGHKEHPADNALLRDIHFEPIAGPKRVFLIQDAEGLGRGGADAGNSLLKTLEEPPPYAHFVLTAASLGGILPTIVSRCQVVPFGLLPTGEIETALVTRFGVAPALAHFLAAYSEGRLGRAVTLARAPALLQARDSLLDIALDLAAAPPVKSFKLGEEFRKAAGKFKAASLDDETAGEERGAREPVGRALDLMVTFYRDLLAVTVGGDAAKLVNLDRDDAIRRTAARYERAPLEQGIELIFAMRRVVERNANVQMAIDTLFLRLTMLRGN